MTISSLSGCCHAPSVIQKIRIGQNGHRNLPVNLPLHGRRRSFPPSRYRNNTLNCSLGEEGEKEEYGRGAVEQAERLFSNLNQVTMKREPGSLSSAAFLVAGTTIGAGILAIPAVTQEAGFLASSVTCISCWVYMVVTGLLIAEVNVNTMCDLGSGGVSLVSMAERTLGKVGVQISCWSYIFIHYALLVAYIARSSDILATFFNMPLWEGALLFTSVFGSICYFGSQRFLGAVNGILVFGILLSFVVLVALAGNDMQWNSLLQFHLEAAPKSIPNVVPVLCTNLEGNLSKVRTAMVLGTAVPLVLFLIWDAVILGTVPNLELNGDLVMDPLQHLRSSNGFIGPVVETFSLLAIGTSYIGFVLGLSDFLSDLLKQPAGQNRPLPYILTIFPPFVLALLDPEIFFRALDFAGTYGVLVLFGMFPAAMSWSERYSNESLSTIVSPLVPGGRFTLSLVIGGAALVIFSEILENFSL